MAYPSTIDSFTNPVAGDYMDAVGHSGNHTAVEDAIVALEGAIGVDNSAVTTSLDYKIRNPASFPGHTHTSAEVVSGIFGRARIGSLGTPTVNTLLNSTGANQTWKLVAPADIGSSPSSAKIFRGDGTWQTAVIDTALCEVITTTNFIAALGSTNPLSHTLGVVPKFVRIYASVPPKVTPIASADKRIFSYGTATSTSSQQCVAIGNSTAVGSATYTGASYSTSSGVIILNPNSAQNFTFAITTLSSTQIILTVTAASNPIDVFASMAIIELYA